MSVEKHLMDITSQLGQTIGAKNISPVPNATPEAFVDTQQTYMEQYLREQEEDSDDDPYTNWELDVLYKVQLLEKMHNSPALPSYTSNLFSVQTHPQHPSVVSIRGTTELFDAIFGAVDVYNATPCQTFFPHSDGQGFDILLFDKVLFLVSNDMGQCLYIECNGADITLTETTLPSIHLDGIEFASSKEIFDHLLSNSAIDVTSVLDTLSPARLSHFSRYIIEPLSNLPSLESPMSSTVEKIATYFYSDSDISLYKV